MSGPSRSVPRKASRLHTRELGDEVLVVDTGTDQAHVLTGPAADEWRAAGPGLTRRALLQRAGTVAVAGAVITIAMPEVVAAASGLKPTNAGLTTDNGVPNQITLTATVTPTDTTDNGSAETGTVTFFQVDASTTPHTRTQVGSPTSVSGTQATLTLTGLPSSASRTYQADYSGDAAYAPSQTAEVTTVVAQPKLASTTTITGTQDTRKNKSWTATVTVGGVGGTPTGTVTMNVTGATVTPASATLSAGTATFTIKNPFTKGNAVTVQASYGGDPSFNGSSSSTVSYTT